jgi:hypothetical protein
MMRQRTQAINALRGHFSVDGTLMTVTRVAQLGFPSFS